MTICIPFNADIHILGAFFEEKKNEKVRPEGCMNKATMEPLLRALPSGAQQCWGNGSEGQLLPPFLIWLLL